MERFFKKHGHHLDERHALDLIHNKIEEAKCNLKEGKEYLIMLMEADGMINDIFSIKRIDPSQYEQQGQEYQQDQNKNEEQDYQNKYPQYARGVRNVYR